MYVCTCLEHPLRIFLWICVHGTGGNLEFHLVKDVDFNVKHEPREIASVSAISRVTLPREIVFSYVKRRTCGADTEQRVLGSRVSERTNKRDSMRRITTRYGKKLARRDRSMTYATVWRPLITSVNHELRMLRCVWHLPLSPFRCKDNRSTWRVCRRSCVHAQRDRQARVALCVPFCLRFTGVPAAD